MKERCAEGFVTGVVVGISGAFLGGVAYFVLTRTLHSKEALEERTPRDPARTSAVIASRNATYHARHMEDASA